MRRCLHACLIGVLTLSLSMDAARACWFLRRGCRPHHSAVVSCPPPACIAAPACVVVECVAVDEPVGGSLASAEPIAPSADPAEPIQQPTLADSAAMERPTAVTTDVPELKPAGGEGSADVQQAVAINEPATDQAPMSEPAEEPTTPVEPPMQEEPAAVAADETAPVVEPLEGAIPEPLPAAEPNLFEEADKDLDATDAASPPSETAPPMTEPADDATPPVPEATENAGTADAEEQPRPSVEPVEGEAAPAPAEESVNPLDAAASRAGEPARLWIDATGRSSVVGVLVGVRADGTCVLDTGAGLLEVRSSDLRGRDRDYVTQAAERLATRRAPAAADTAAR